MSPFIMIGLATLLIYELGYCGLISFVFSVLTLIIVGKIANIGASIY
jgi:hypothetical protein